MTYSVKELFDVFNINYPLVCICGIWGKLYRTEIIKKFSIRFDMKLSLGEDIVFNYDYYRHINSIFFSAKVYYHYDLGNNESLSGKYNYDLYETNVHIYDIMRGLMIQNHCTNDSLRRFDVFYAQAIINCVYHEYLFCKKSTPQSRKAIIHKVSNNPYVQKCPLNTCKNPKELQLMVLLKARMYELVYAEFNSHYCKS